MINVSLTICITTQTAAIRNVFSLVGKKHPSEKG
jgi:hypothetical protein